VLIVRDGWGGKAFYQVQDRYGTTSRRPQADDYAASNLRYETLEHGPDDDMPQAIRVTDHQGRSAIYRPLIKDGRVVDPRGVPLGPGDSGEMVEGMRFALERADPEAS
jgi:hypothetical protein